MKEPFRITRKIEIDAGHRVPDHGSKCRNIHGHRYVVEATVTGDLSQEGSDKGMVMDFSFLKGLLELHVDALCDHALILYQGDSLLQHMLSTWLKEIDHQISELGYAMLSNDVHRLPDGLGKVCVVTFVPTAENLARWWYSKLWKPVHGASKGRAALEKIRVYETPNCWSDYPVK